MELLTYSTDPCSELNSARRSLWAAKHMLGESNKAPASYNKGFWMGQINRRRNELRKLAHKMRAKTCTTTA